MSDLQIYEESVRLIQAGIAFALATIVESSGSTPRKTGAKMLIKNDGTALGTVGGGKVETEIISEARAAITSGSSRVITFDLTEEYGHVCGGKLSIYIEAVGSMPRLIIFGAGHVGRALALTASMADFRVTLVADADCPYLQGTITGAHEVIVSSAEEVFAKHIIDSESFLVIATTTHEDDFAIARLALTTSARYIGLLGSKRKRAVLEKIMADEGVSPEAYARIVTPVGLHIGAETPAEIAISIVAQLIQARREHAAARLGDSACSRNVATDGKL